MLEHILLECQITEEFFGMRLDQVLAELFSDYSRSRIKIWIQKGCVTIDQQVIVSPKYKLQGSEYVKITTEIEIENKYLAEDISLDIVHEDDDIIILNKPKNLVVHPGAGNTSGTLLNALLHYYPKIEEVPRAGIIHRLDKDTTGLMVVAKNIPTHTYLVNKLQNREIIREYEALVIGIMTKGGMVDQPIARHSVKRTQMAVHPFGKPAVTHYRIMEHFRDYTRLRLRLETGRTHQIRVHMAYISHPILGDPIYSGRLKLPKNISIELLDFLRSFRRQALFATKLAFVHPTTGQQMQWSIEPPEDLQRLINLLKQDYLLHKDKLDY